MLLSKAFFFGETFSLPPPFMTLFAIAKHFLSHKQNQLWTLSANEYVAGGGEQSQF